MTSQQLLIYENMKILRKLQIFTFFFEEKY